MYKLNNVVDGATCFKNPENPSCIDFILTSRRRSSQECHIIESGLLDFNRMTNTFMKVYFKTEAPSINNITYLIVLHTIITYYRDYKMFNTQHILQDIFVNLQKGNVEIDQLEKFAAICKTVLDRHTSIKKRYVRANRGPLINIILQKEVIDSATNF